MTETEQFIEIVRSYSVLYDLSHPEYKNIRKKDKIWDEIANSSGKNSEDLKKKWKNLRDSYSKHLRTEKKRTGQETKILDRYKTWPWAQQMEFLRPFLQFSKTDSNVSTQPLREQRDGEDTDSNVSNQPLREQRDGEDDNLVEISEIEEERVSQQSQPLRAKTHAPVQQVTPTAYRKRKSEKAEAEKAAHPTSVQQVLTYLENRQINSNLGLDDIDLMCMGYAKTIKKFSPRRQTMVKFKMSQILMEAELAQQTDDEQDNQERRAPLSTFSRPCSSASAHTSLSDSSFLPPLESEICSNLVPEIESQAKPSTSWYDEFGLPVNNYEQL